MGSDRRYRRMGLQAFLGVDGWIISCGSLNVAIGMALHLLILS